MSSADTVFGLTSFIEADLGMKSRSRHIFCFPAADPIAELVTVD